eukprot:7908353-Lingulodinium_polyedra.AAC.1
MSEHFENSEDPRSTGRQGVPIRNTPKYPLRKSLGMPGILGHSNVLRDRNGGMVKHLGFNEISWHPAPST